MPTTYRITGKIWKYPGFGGWHFVTIRKKTSRDMRDFMKGQTRGFGSIRVEARVGKSRWKTSVFPTKEGTYLLPVKSTVREKEGLEEGDLVKAELSL